MAPSKLYSWIRPWSSFTLIHSYLRQRRRLAIANISLNSTGHAHIEQTPRSNRDTDENWELHPMILSKLSISRIVCHRKSYVAKKTRWFGLHSSRKKSRYIFNHFYAIHPGSSRVRWNNAKEGPFSVQGNSRSPILVPIESSLHGFLLVINTNLPPILHRFRLIVSESSKIAIFGYPSCV